MLKKGALALALLTALYAVAGFFILPAWLRPVMEEKLSLALNRKVTIGELTVNPFALSVAVRGFTMREKGGAATFVSFDELSLNAQARSIFKGGPVVREITLTGPRVALTRLDAKRYNFSDLLEKKRPAAEEKPKKPLRFSVGNIVVKNGTVLFRDEVAKTSHTADRIDLSIPFISNLDEFLDVYVQPRFSARVNGTTFTLAGESKPFKDSLETSLALDLEGISLPFYLGYLPEGLKLGVTSGTIDLKTRLSYVQYKSRKPNLTVVGNLAVHNLSLRDRAGEPLLDLPETRLALAPSPVLDRLAHVSSLEFESPGLSVTRDASGTLNLASLSGPEKKPPEDEQKPPFVVKLDRVSLADGRVLFTDASKEGPVRLALGGIKLEARGLSTGPGSRGSFELSSKINDRCTLGASATLGLKPLDCEAKLDLAGFEPAWVQPYFTDKVRILLTRGSCTLAGTLKVSKDTSLKPRVAFSGKAALSDFVSLDKATSEDFLRCRALSLNSMKLGLNPGFVDIGTVAVRGLSSRVIVARDGTLNVTSVVKKGGKPKKTAPGPGGGKKTFEKIAIGQVVVDGARVLFVDRSVREGYSAELSRLKGTVRGISSSRSSRADVKLSGLLNRSAPVLLTGRINPFKENLYVNLHTSLTDLDLSPMTPYAGTYVGYAVDKGKLSLDLTYLIDRKNLDSQNNIFIDQFTFGQGMESPRATKLPVRFAVSLLKDARGRIDLKIPVKGRTDDPQFSVWGIVLTVLKNLVVKAATSPFALLEAMYPGASESNAVEFAYGSDDLPEGAAGKIAPLLKILADKPSLNVEVRGYADPEKDRQGLETVSFENKVKSQKLKALVRKGAKGATLRDVSLSAEEYPVYLKKAYAAEDFPKPRNFVGLAVDLPPAQMEKLMREHIEVTPGDLRLLAESRARKVQGLLAADRTVAPSRIFLIGAGNGAPSSRDGMKTSRVELTLK